MLILCLVAQQAETSLQVERKRVEELKSDFKREAEDIRVAEQKRLQELRSNLEKEKEVSLATERKRSEELLNKIRQESDNGLQSARQEIENIHRDHQREVGGLDAALQSERRTVSLLVTEKANLTAELERRDDLESSALPHCIWLTML